MADLYSIDIQLCGTLCGTLYFRASSANQVREIVEGLKHTALFVQDDGNSETEISGLSKDDPALPDISFSPAMTVYGVWPDEGPVLVEVAENSDD
jgi:hypothetical protein